MLTYREREKRRQGKKGKGVKIEKKRRKIVKGKVENLKKRKKNGSRKSYKTKGEDPLFFFCFVCFSLLKTTEICFGSTKMGIFNREKAFHAGKKNQEK